MGADIRWWYGVVGVWGGWCEAADNSVGDKGAQALAEALKTNSSVTTINLKGKPVHAVGRGKGGSHWRMEGRGARREREREGAAGMGSR